MEKDTREQAGEVIGSNEEALMDRRGFLLGLKKWSKIVIGGALLGSALLNAGAERDAEAAGWANRGGGGGRAWVNGGGGGGAWANRVGGGGAWANRGAGWINRGGSWVNRF
jgi:rSAM-associated Gly-rich repeat protein